MSLQGKLLVPLALAIVWAVAAAPQAHAISLVGPPTQVNVNAVQVWYGGQWHDYQICYGDAATSAAMMQLQQVRRDSRPVFRGVQNVRLVWPYGTDPQQTGQWNLETESGLTPLPPTMTVTVASPSPSGQPQLTSASFTGTWEGEFTNSSLVGNVLPWRTRQISITDRGGRLEMLFTDADGQPGSVLGPNARIVLAGAQDREELKFDGSAKGRYYFVRFRLAGQGMATCEYAVYRSQGPDGVAAPAMNEGPLYTGQWRGLRKIR